MELRVGENMALLDSCEEDNRVIVAGPLSLLLNDWCWCNTLVLLTVLAVSSLVMLMVVVLTPSLPIQLVLGILNVWSNIGRPSTSEKISIVEIFD